MSNVNVEFKPLKGPNINKIYQISKLRLASCYFRIQRAESSFRRILTSLGKTIIIYNLLKNANGYLIKSDDYFNNDPTEKEIYSYYLGMATCKWVSEELFRIPHLHHFSLARKVPQLTVNTTSTKCPDLVGKDNNGKFWLFEAKGTSGDFDRKQIYTGKQQLKNITILGNTPGSIVTECFFHKNIFSIYVEDPAYRGSKHYEYFDNIVIRDYYRNIVKLLNFRGRRIGNRFVFYRSINMRDMKANVQIGLNKQIYDLYTHENYWGIRELVERGLEPIERDNEYMSQDGISLKIILD